MLRPAAARWTRTCSQPSSVHRDRARRGQALGRRGHAGRGRVREALDEALKLLKDPHIRYRQAEPDVRWFLSQALLRELLIREENVAEAKPSLWVTEIRIARAPQGCPQPKFCIALSTRRIFGVGPSYESWSQPRFVERSSALGIVKDGVLADP